MEEQAQNSQPQVQPPQPQPQPQSQSQPPVPPPDHTPIVPPKPHTFTVGYVIIGLSMLLVGLSVGFILFGYKTNPPKSSIKSPTPSVKVVTVTKTPEKKTLKTYKDQYGLLHFSVPEDWQVKTEIVTKDFYGNTMEFPLERIQITRNDWKIQLDVQQNYTSGKCGYIGGIEDDEFVNNLQKKKKITFLTRTVYRSSLKGEDYWAGGDAPTPYPQPIFFESIGPTKTVTDEKSQLYGKKIYELPFCYENFEKSLGITIHYASPTFTPEIIKANKIDYLTLEEMDSILESFRLVEEKM